MINFCLLLIKKEDSNSTRITSGRHFAEDCFLLELDLCPQDGTVEMGKNWRKAPGWGLGGGQGISGKPEGPQQGWERAELYISRGQRTTSQAGHECRLESQLETESSSSATKFS